MTNREKRTLKAKSKVDQVAGFLTGLADGLKETGSKSSHLTKELRNQVHKLEQASDILRENLQ